MAFSREEIIQSLKCCSDESGEACAKCPRFHVETHSMRDCMEELIQDTLEILEEKNEGYWIEHVHTNYEGEHRGSHYECSNCHKDDYPDIKHKKDMNYCNKCGSKLTEVKVIYE